MRQLQQSLGASDEYRVLGIVSISAMGIHVLKYSRQPTIKEEHACFQAPDECNVKTPPSNVRFRTLYNIMFLALGQRESLFFCHANNGAPFAFIAVVSC